MSDKELEPRGEERFNLYRFILIVEYEEGRGECSCLAHSVLDSDSLAS